MLMMKVGKYMKNNYTVYTHISPSNKRYIGITCQEPKKRWKGGSGYKSNIHFTRAIEKYGWNNFQHIIIAKGLTEDEAKWLEIELVRKWDSTNKDKGYNISLGGDIISEDTKKKISQANKGRKVSEDTREKISQANKGKGMYGKGYLMSDENNHGARKIILLNTKEIFTTIKNGAKKYNCDESSVVKCCNGKTKSCGKLKDGQPLVWMYYEEYLNIEEKEIEQKIKNADIRVVCITTKEIFLNAKEGAEKYNIYKNSILQCCNGKRKSAGKHPITNEKLVWVKYNEWELYEK